MSIYNYIVTGDNLVLQKEKPRLAFMISTLNNGGAERTVSNLTLAMSSDFEVYLILYDASNISYDYAGELIEIEIPASSSYVVKLINFIRKIRKVKKIKKKYQFLTVISFLQGPNIINILTKHNEKIIVSIRNYLGIKNNALQKMDYLFRKFFYMRADKIVVVSEALKKYLVEQEKISKEKILTINNGLNFEYIYNLQGEDLGSQNKRIFKKPVLISIGRLVHQKGYIYLLQALKRLLKDQDVNLVILGDGPLRNSLEKLTNELDITNNVFFLGYVENPFKFISNSQVFVLGSLYEGFPNAMIEAMACGIPIVSTDCQSGPREILAPMKFDLNPIDYSVPQEFGYLVPALSKENNNENKVIEYLKTGIEFMLIKENNKTYSKKSRVRSKDFSIEKISDNWAHIINEA
jgi:glycosyltransferase involved in cell wall biosynthesis